MCVKSSPTEKSNIRYRKNTEIFALNCKKDILLSMFHIWIYALFVIENISQNTKNDLRFELFFGHKVLYQSFVEKNT